MVLEVFQNFHERVLIILLGTLVGIVGVIGELVESGSCSLLAGDQYILILLEFFEEGKFLRRS